MPPDVPLTLARLLVAAITVGAGLAVLRIIGRQIDHERRSHDLRVEVRRLRAAQRRRLDRVAAGDGSADVVPEPPAAEPPAAVTAEPTLARAA